MSDNNANAPPPAGGANPGGDETKPKVEGAAAGEAEGKHIQLRVVSQVRNLVGERAQKHTPIPLVALAFDVVHSVTPTPTHVVLLYGGCCSTYASHLFLLYILFPLLPLSKLTPPCV